MTNTTARRSAASAQRAMLLVSAAALSLGTATAAQAQDAGSFAPVLEAQGDHPIVTAPTPQIVIADPGTPDTALDTTDVNGVGQMVTDIGGGFIGLCTATLINPRTVVFAAHCVNEQPANTYGAGNGGTPIGFGFSNSNLNGIIGWYLDGANFHKTNTAAAFFNSNYVAYNPASTEPNAAHFLYSDVAVASLDTPAAGIPTWAMLFSPLPPVQATAEGTGYHVTITGYGNNGSASTGSTGGIDFRRRSADNMLGALASLDDFEGFLFGQAAGLPQNLYWIDFDDPRRGNADASPYDFNAWRDNATAHEGITASGDSGGPLILDSTYQMKVIIGTLSGGYTRFFNGQPPNGYGTASFYQPLYLYWDWIAQNNPYHYVSAKAGNGNWADPNHWQTTLDPNYMVIDANGNLVNGIPTAPGGGTTDTSGKFGTACFQSGGISDCYDTTTGTETVEQKPIGTSGTTDAGHAQSLPTTVAAGTLTGGGLSNDAATISSAALSSQSATAQAATPAALPPATLGNGLPGASGFVPNNSDGDPNNGVAPRYFDVTLSADGTTTLDTGVTIDRFAITGMGAALDIASTGSLTSLIDVNQYQGMMRVNGTLRTAGDYMLMFGSLQGSGHIYTPFFTNVAGVIAPGGVGSIGTLTFHGDVVLSNGSTYLVDLGANGASDRIAVRATAFDADNDPLDGQASIGGHAVFGVAPGAMVRDGDVFTILTAEGGVDGTFLAPNAISAILTPTLSYTPNAVRATIHAGSYLNVVDHNSAVQKSYARLLDRDRARYGNLANLYGPLDLQNAATIRATLQGLAPQVQTLVGSLGMAAVDTVSQFNRDRLAKFVPGASGGQLTMVGHPLDLAANAVRGGSDVAADASETLVQDGALPDNVSVYLAGGYINGDAAPMTGMAGRNDFDGWFGTAGVELNVGGTGMVGFSGAYSDLNGDVRGAPQTAETELFQGTVYGRVGAPGGLSLDAQLGIGVLNTRTSRTVGFLGTNYTLKSRKQASVFNGEIGVSDQIAAGSLLITPRASFRENSLRYGTVVESGGPMALASHIGTYRNSQARAGLSLETAGGVVRPYLNANYVHDFESRPAVFDADFVGGTGVQQPFALTGSDHDWAEASGGLTYSTGKIDFSVSAETSIWRSDVSMQSYRGALTIHF